MISEGDSVPKFELLDSEGKSVKSSDLKGKKYVIYFYPKDFTPGCTTEADEFTKDYNKFKKVGIEIVGISKDDVESHKKFCQKMKIPYILLADTGTDIAKKIWCVGQKKFHGKRVHGNNSKYLFGRRERKNIQSISKSKASRTCKRSTRSFYKLKIE